MTPRTLRSTALLVALASGAPGCSWAFMTRAPAQVSAPHYPVECTSSRTAPVLDAICGGYFVANGIVWATRKDCDSASFGEKCYSKDDKTTGVLLSAGLAALCTASAVTGFAGAERCAELRQVNALCITGHEEACRQLQPSWVPPPGWSPRGTLPPPPPGMPGTTPVPPGDAAPGMAPPPPPTPAVGCSKDTDCKGDRVCEAGRCVSPPAGK